MKTARKIQLARLAYRAVRLGRTIVGRSDRCIVARDGLKYDLDLSQGVDFAIYFGDIFERSTRAALRRLVAPSALVLDIGANIGAHTLQLAKLVGSAGRVLAFEPTDFAFRKQARNLELNPELAQRVTAYHCFLAAEDEAPVPGAIYSSWPLTQGSERHAKHLGQEMPTLSAPARSIDSILREHGEAKVQLVKLDVDGFECEILRGATNLLRVCRPIFIMELAPYVLAERGTSLEELLSFFLPNGYRLYDEQHERPLPSTAAELENLIGDGESINVIARV
ncbi:FkbM family methyltransferase [Bradyrhizobium sp. AUGA SZCCT0158]|uniref:FkbM family methyltransferase n=1 Tax=Bradyrhizobium sp. AUGA SZCCT0158 TaxID=2807661 RepID=UPI001BADA6ED|nr:FkbM family methyltransferase [Bradyrhizobium sp. AUGA SZCCT0158]MBR1199479.1 FkbM family methyltransferase [Bradyrhizobium sp. AUGA SZCCT0158]